MTGSVATGRMFGVARGDLFVGVRHGLQPLTAAPVDGCICVRSAPSM